MVRLQNRPKLVAGHRQADALDEAGWLVAIQQAAAVVVHSGRGVDAGAPQVAGHS